MQRFTMKGGVTIPIHKEFSHPSTFGATHQGVLWQHAVPKHTRFFASNFLWAILVNVVTTSKDHLIHGNGPRCSPVEKSHTIYDAFLRSSCHGGSDRHVFLFWKAEMWNICPTSRHPPEMPWSLEVWKGPLKNEGLWRCLWVTPA